MDRHLVLLKFFNANRQIQKYREENPPTKSEYNEIINKISGSGRDILCFLLNFEGTNQRNIAKNMDISSQAVSEMIKKLVNLELIQKVSGSQNNENIICLTDFGKIIAKRLDFAVKDHANHVFSNLNDEEIEQFSKLLDKIV